MYMSTQDMQTTRRSICDGPQFPPSRRFFDEHTNTISYLVADPATKRAAIVDPVLDYEHASGKASTKSADAILKEAAAHGLTVDWVLEGHAHADHLSGAPYIKLKTGAKVGIGEHIRDVQKIFRPVFNATDVKGDGSEFDHLFKEGERFKLGNIDAELRAGPHARRNRLQNR
jgi:glyoxylase-like metal-dependent hydrolase (beta-lactamase superfamily II)